MVHTRHSYSKDIEDFTAINGHNNDDVVNGYEEDSIAQEQENTEILNENENNDRKDIEEKEVGNKNSDLKPRKRSGRGMVGLYDNIDFHDSYHRRSLRNLERRRTHPYDHKSNRRMKHSSSLRFQNFGSGIIRRSDRQPKKVFETFNESEIQRSIERKHQEMLEMEQASMYDSIKKRRGDEEDTQDDDDDEEEEDSDEESDEEEGSAEEDEVHAYSLRKTKPKTNYYQAPPLHSNRQRRGVMYEVRSPLHKVKLMKRIPQHASSPHHRRYKRRRRTSSTSSSDDEGAFERRKAKSMNQARMRCLPMNFQLDDMTGALRNRERANGNPMGSSLADVDPMKIDSKTSFSDVGGLDHHIRALKEMVVFPLLYPEVFQKFSISPPRGVLFYGPPGTGKTLVARALANECSSEGKKVAFFMRKGADCLSKWVGESERQLRLLFDQAYQMRPSIIFFDEIDGIAPVRSTRQDQIHSSIVSTLLALMDGLDARGEIVVIGATNRLDAIDPALRRPGRFDREFLFSLPNKTARQKIFEIHTSAWQPRLNKVFLCELADKCVGYCGADIKALCTETALFALRRRYPQIYETNKKLVLDMNEIKVAAVDFKNAMKTITPASHRSSLSPGRSLNESLKPLLQTCIDNGLAVLNKIFPPGQKIQDHALKDAIDFDEDEAPSIFEKPKSRQRGHAVVESSGEFLKTSMQTMDARVIHRPRLLVFGKSGNGQTSYIAPAFLYAMEHLTTHMLDLPALFGTSSRAPEEAVAQVFREARRTTPSIIYLPHIDIWWSSVQETTKATFMTLLHDIPSNSPLLFLATAEVAFSDLPESIQDLFSSINNELIEISSPTSSDRYIFFKELLLVHALKKPVAESTEKRHRRTEVLAVASPAKPRELSAEESKKLVETEEATLRELRLFLRQVVWKLLADRKFKEFSKPVDLGEVDDYLEVIKQPMDLSTVLTRINAHHYHTCAHFLDDVNLITNNCLEYNPDKDQYDKLLRNRACELRDVAHAFVHNDLDPEFEKLCIEIHQSRINRGYDVNAHAPSFLKVRSKSKNTNTSTMEVDEGNTSSTKPVVGDPTGPRFSRRVRGLSEPYEFDTSTLDLIEKNKRAAKKTVKLTSEVLDTNYNSTCSVPDEPQIEENSVKNAVEDEKASYQHENDVEITNTEEKIVDNVKRNLEFQEVRQSEVPNLVEEAEDLLSKLVENTDGCTVQTLERLYTDICRCIHSHKDEENRYIVLLDLQTVIKRIRQHQTS